MKTLVVGNPKRFAIESGITQAYARINFRALGFFVVHIHGSIYGVREPDASMLACSFDKVADRIKRRGKHVSHLVRENAANIAEAYRSVLYIGDQPDRCFFSMEQHAFAKHVYASKISWAPDGDEAFDDGSYILQFDDETTVRLIAFKSMDTLQESIATLSNITIDAAEYYGILNEWHTKFEAEWLAAPKDDA